MRELRMRAQRARARAQEISRARQAWRGSPRARARAVGRHAAARRARPRARARARRSCSWTSRSARSTPDPRQLAGGAGAHLGEPDKTIVFVTHDIAEAVTARQPRYRLLARPAGACAVVSMWPSFCRARATSTEPAVLSSRRGSNRCSTNARRRRMVRRSRQDTGRAASGALGAWRSCSSVWACLSRFGPWPRYLLPGPLRRGASLVHSARNGTLPRAVSAVARATLPRLRHLGGGRHLARDLWARRGSDADARSDGGRTSGAAVDLLAAAGASLVRAFARKRSCSWWSWARCLAIAIATEGAVRAVPPLYVRAARTMGARRLRLYTRVILPASLPGIITGLKLGWTFAWRSLMAGELLMSPAASDSCSPSGASSTTWRA